jgi:hypothetical protein
MIVVPGSIQARMTFTSMSAVLSGTRTRNVLLDSCSTPPNTHWPLNRVSLIVFSPTELAVVDLDGLVRTADLLRAAFEVNQHSLTAEHTPVGDRVITKVMFVLDVVGRFAAQDVREVQNLLEGKVTIVEPRAVPDRPRPRTPGSTYHPTSPPETTRNGGICVRSHHDRRSYTAPYCELFQRPDASFRNCTPVA